MTESEQVRNQLKNLMTRSYKTYRARQSACARLGQRARAWNWAVISLSTATTVAAIGMLTKPSMYGENGGTLMVCLSVLVLVATLGTTNMDYSGRSRDMFLNYRKIQRLSVELENQLGTNDHLDSKYLIEVSDRYQAILDETENHTVGDHLKHYSQSLEEDSSYFTNDDEFLKRRKRRVLLDRAITFFPYATLAIPAVLLVPLVGSLVQ